MIKYFKTLDDIDKDNKEVVKVTSAKRTIISENVILLNRHTLRIFVFYKKFTFHS